MIAENPTAPRCVGVWVITRGFCWTGHAKQRRKTAGQAMGMPMCHAARRGKASADSNEASCQRPCGVLRRSCLVLSRFFYCQGDKRSYVDVPMLVPSMDVFEKHDRASALGGLERTTRPLIGVRMESDTACCCRLVELPVRVWWSYIACMRRLFHCVGSSRGLM